MRGWFEDIVACAVLLGFIATLIVWAAVLQPLPDNFTNSHPVIHDFKVNAGGSNVSAD